MDNYYEFNVFNREVSLIVSPIDRYTGQAAAGEHIDVRLKGSRQRAIVKSEGFYVFINLPVGVWEVEILSKEYFKEAFTVDIQSPGIIIKAPIIPSRGYKLPGNATFIDGMWKKDMRVYVMPVGGENAVKLRKQEDNLITVRTLSNRDLSGQLFAFYEDGEMEVFGVDGKVEKNIYRIKNNLGREYKSGANIYPVSIAKTDDSGYLFCPVRGFHEESKNILIRAEYMDSVFYQDCDILYGRGNNIKNFAGDETT